MSSNEESFKLIGTDEAGSYINSSIFITKSDYKQIMSIMSKFSFFEAFDNGVKEGVFDNIRWVEFRIKGKIERYRGRSTHTLTIRKFEDDYFIIQVNESFYLCDQIQGLLECLSFLTKDAKEFDENIMEKLRFLKRNYYSLEQKISATIHSMVYEDNSDKMSNQQVDFFYNAFLELLKK